MFSCLILPLEVKSVTLLSRGGAGSWAAVAVPAGRGISINIISALARAPCRCTEVLLVLCY